MIRIDTIDQLKAEAIYDDSKGASEFFILLNGGSRSSKRIIYYEDSNRFDIYNYIDDTWEDDLTVEELINLTNIGVAIEKKAFFKFD